LDFGSDVAAIFHRRKFRAEVLYRRRDAILSSAFARYHGAGEAGVGRHPWSGRRAGAPESLSYCGAVLILPFRPGAKMKPQYLTRTEQCARRKSFARSALRPRSRKRCATWLTKR